MAVIANRRAIGAYYSPEPYARALVKWALAGRPGAVMDPSYGGCAVLRVALDELSELNAEEPTDLIFGADIDGVAANWASHLISQGVPNDHLRSADFFSIAPGEELPRVAAVVGNPPYVRHHDIDSQTHARATAAMASAGVALSGRASLWAYFVIHACRFVEPGGRLALLLPGAVLQADYSPQVLRFVQRCFSDVLLVRVAERLFLDAEEETVVLVAAGAYERPVPIGSPSAFRIAEADDLAGLERVLDDHVRAGVRAIDVGVDGVAPWKASVIDSGCRRLLTELFEHEHVSSLGEVAQISLGTVTGANSFFVVNEAVANDLKVDWATVPVVARSAWLVGPELTMDGLRDSASSGRDRLIALPPKTRIDRRTRLGRYISEGERDGLPERSHCRRDPWWSLEDVRIPDAFLPYTVGSPRGLVLNTARAASTNTVHQVTWGKPFTNAQARSWTISTWSAVGRLAVELFGRHYGGGVLKLELSDARRISVVDGLAADPALLKACRGSSAVTFAAADKALLDSKLGLSPGDIRLLNESAQALAARRVPSRLASDGRDALHDVGTTA